MSTYTEALTQSQSSSQFRTSRLALAAYLTAAKLLRLVKIEVEPDSKFAEFVFADIGQRGPELEARFLSGDAMVDANSFHQQLRNLRKEIDLKTSSVRRDANSGKSDNDKGNENESRQTY